MNRTKIIYIGIVLIITVIASMTYFSYAFFTREDEYHGRLNIVAGTLDYRIESNYLENNSITLSSKEVKEIDISVVSMNDMSTEYDLNYASTGDVLVYYSSATPDLPRGQISANEVKNIKVILKNRISDDNTVTFDVNGGFADKELEIVEEKESITEVMVECSYSIGDIVKTAGYTGGADSFIPLCDGKYKIELWGAAGGESRTKAGWATNEVWNTYGYGGYAKGEISLTTEDELFIYVGKKGATGILGSGSKSGQTFNGGGSGIGSADNDDAGGSGGGATDIRLVSGNWDNFDSLKSRIMVAGGGSGSAVVSKTFSQRAGGSGGGLSGNGSTWRYNNAEYKNPPYNATQTTGYSFGKGEDGLSKGNAGGAGAGGGYYGGLANKESTAGGAGGGSGFISGYEGCNAISESSTATKITHTGSSIHYSNRVFLYGVLKNGNEEMPTPDGSSTMIGNGSDGYAKITYLGK